MRKNEKKCMRIIPPEELLKSPKTGENVCLEPVCEENCPRCPVGLKT